MLIFPGLAEPAGERTCRLVLMEDEGFTADCYTLAVPRLSTAEFTLTLEEGYVLDGCDDPAFQILHATDGTIRLVLPEVRYTQAVHLLLHASPAVIRYMANGGQRHDGGDPEEAVVMPASAAHIRPNTDTGRLFYRDGFTLTGWNTSPDGTGARTGLGSRVNADKNPMLYAIWQKWTDPEAFEVTSFRDGWAIVSCRSPDETVCVPETIDGLPVRAILSGAFRDAPLRELVLPPSLQVLENGAFTHASVRTVTVSDTLLSFSDYAFEDCPDFQTLQINAVLPPVYSGTYYDVFCDKMDRLMQLEDQPKLVLFSGSSARFGYDSAAIDAAFPELDVVNMGVFAYTNALPQLDLIRRFMHAPDILVHSPEFDASQRQFCVFSTLDEAFFKMIEGNYDLLSLLDLRDYGQVLTAFHSFLRSRDGMDARSYDVSPGDYDEDGNPVPESSYNSYGDYVVFRPNSPDDSPVYGLPVRYTPQAFPREALIEPLNRVYRTFLDLGIRVYFTYSPRNRLALSEDSTEEAIRAMDDHLRACLCVPVITHPLDSLYRGMYLYGTDNHLSTEGVQMHTRALIDALSGQLRMENGQASQDETEKEETP